MGFETVKSAHRWDGQHILHTYKKLAFSRKAIAHMPRISGVKSNNGGYDGGCGCGRVEGRRAKGNLERVGGGKRPPTTGAPKIG